MRTFYTSSSRAPDAGDAGPAPPVWRARACSDAEALSQVQGTAASKRPRAQGGHRLRAPGTRGRRYGGPSPLARRSSSRARPASTHPSGLPRMLRLRSSAGSQATRANTGWRIDPVRTRKVPARIAGMGEVRPGPQRCCTAATYRNPGICQEPPSTVRCL